MQQSPNWGESEKQTFDTGAQRDAQRDKLRYDLIPSSALARLAKVYTLGAKKYGDRNYEKGIPMMRCVASLKRHLENWLQRGQPVEQTDDDIAQVAWNAFAIMYYQDNNRSDLDDRPRHQTPIFENLKLLFKNLDRDGVSFEPIRSQSSLSSNDGYNVGFCTGKVIRTEKLTRGTIYIAGPMRGIKDYNFAAFDRTKELLTKQGWRVISPADMDRADPIRGVSNTQVPYALRDTKAIIEQCDAICLLTDWWNSKGASAEYFLSRWLDLPVYNQYGRPYEWAYGEATPEKSSDNAMKMFLTHNRG